MESKEKKALFPLLASLVLAFSAKIRGVPGVTKASVPPQHCPATGLQSPWRSAIPNPEHTRTSLTGHPRNYYSECVLCIQVGSQQRTRAFAGCPNGVNKTTFTGIPPSAEFLLEYPNL